MGYLRLLRIWGDYFRLLQILLPPVPPVPPVPPAFTETPFGSFERLAGYACNVTDSQTRDWKREILHLIDSRLH